MQFGDSYVMYNNIVFWIYHVFLSPKSLKVCFLKLCLLSIEVAAISENTQLQTVRPDFEKISVKCSL